MQDRYSVPTGVAHAGGTTTAARPADRLAVRGRALLVACALGVILALGLYASVAADPAEAYEKGVCRHELSIHYGPDGRFHKVWLIGHWTNNRGQHIHRMGHSTKHYGKYFLDWKRNFWCDRYSNA